MKGWFALYRPLYRRFIYGKRVLKVEKKWLVCCVYALPGVTSCADGISYLDYPFRERSDFISINPF